MINTFLLGKNLTKLFNDEKILVNKLFPLVASEGTNQPFAVYKRTGHSSNGCKDGYFEDDVTFEINIITNTYSESINLAQSVREILERERIVMNDFTMHNCLIVNSSEEYTDGVYIQTLIFNAKIN